MNDYQDMLLILLVGSNPLPNYLSACVVKPKRIAFIYTEQTKRAMTRLQKQLSKKLPGCDLESIYELSTASNPVEMQRKMKEVCSLHSHEKICLNYTGGTKVMAVHAHTALRVAATDRDSNALQNGKAQFFYLDDGGKDGPGLWFDIGNRQPLLIEEVRLDLPTILGLHGLICKARKKCEPSPTTADAQEIFNKVLLDLELKEKQAQGLVADLYSEKQRLASKSSEKRQSESETLSETGPDAVPEIGPGAEPEIGPGPVPEIGPGAVPEIEPGAVPEIGPGAVRERVPGYVPEIGPGSVSRLGADLIRESGIKKTPKLNKLEEALANPFRAQTFGLELSQDIFPTAEVLDSLANKHAGESWLKQWYNFIGGEWLEDWVGDLIRDNAVELEIDPNNSVIVGVEAFRSRGGENAAKEKKIGQIQIDIAVVRKCRTYFISCTTDGTKNICKSKIFEIALRAQQLGGDLARAALVCLAENHTLQKLRLEVDDDDANADQQQFSIPGAAGVKVFGIEDLKHWSGFGGKIANTSSLLEWMKK